MVDNINLLQSSYMFKGLEHTAIASPQPEKLARWYVDHLGFIINYTYDGNYFVKAANGNMCSRSSLPREHPCRKR